METSRILPDADLGAEDLAFAARLRAFAQDKLAPHARASDEERRFRPEMVQDLAAAGVLGGPLEPAHGGEGWSPMQVAIANEEVGAVCGNARGFMAVQTGLVAQCLERFGSTAQRDAWLPGLVDGSTVGCFGLTEEEAGSDVASLRCRAIRLDEGQGYRLEGKKIWTTNGPIADICLLFASVDPDLGHKGITCFLVPLDHAGISRPPMPGDELGHRASPHSQLVFDSVEVAADAVVGEVGEGFKVAMAGLACGRISVAAGAVGIHRAALQASVDFVRARQQFGKPLAKFQMVQERIADMATELIAARQLVYRCARHRAAGTETHADLAAAKLYATEAASRAADTAIQLHGGRGYTSAYPVERLLRDSIALRIYEGTSMIQKAILAREILA